MQPSHSLPAPQRISGWHDSVWPCSHLSFSTASACLHPGWARAGFLTLAFVIIAVDSGPLLAQSSSSSYQIPRQSIDSGAGRATSASYSLNGSIGQPDAGARMTSASFRLAGGFHRANTVEPGDDIFADRFQGH